MIERTRLATKKYVWRRPLRACAALCRCNCAIGRRAALAPRFLPRCAPERACRARWTASDDDACRGGRRSRRPALAAVLEPEPDRRARRTVLADDDDDGEYDDDAADDDDEDEKEEDSEHARRELE